MIVQAKAIELQVKLPLVFLYLDRNTENVSLFLKIVSVEQNLMERLLSPLTGCTYFDAGGFVVVFPFSSDCMWFSKASKRLFGALKE